MLPITMLRIPVYLPLSLLVSLSGACSRKPKVAAPVKMETIPAPTAPVRPEPPPGPPLSITATVRADGQISVVGKDKWNQPLSFTYQDAWYFRNALDSLDRWVNEPELKMLRDLAVTLPEVPAPPPLPGQAEEAKAPARAKTIPRIRITTP